MLAFCVAAAAQMANSLAPEGMVNMTDRQLYITTPSDYLPLTSCLSNTDFYGQTLGRKSWEKSWQDCGKQPDCNLDYFYRKLSTKFFFKSSTLQIQAYSFNWSKLVSIWY